MSELPLYAEGREPCPEPAAGGHRGLWFERFFDGYAPGFDALANRDRSKRDFLESVVHAGPAGVRDELERARLRLSVLCTRIGGEPAVYRCAWHFATGLGMPHPVENGLLWHPTLGVPYLPGAAVKGLVRSWVECWADFEDESARLSTLYRWFGSEDKDPEARLAYRRGGQVSTAPSGTDETAAGAFVFFDALPVKPVMLKVDVMTPHMGDWYAQGGRIVDAQREPEKVPADWHAPVPVPFLVASAMSLQFCIAPRTEDAPAELDGVLAALRAALEWLGAGAKTATGYGAFSYDQGGTSSVMDEVGAIAGPVGVDDLPPDLPHDARSLELAYRDGQWASNKSRLVVGLTAFLEEHPQPSPEALARARAWVEAAWEKLLLEPDAVQGKRKKPAFSNAQRELAKRILALGGE